LTNPPLIIHNVVDAVKVMGQFMLKYHLIKIW